MGIQQIGCHQPSAIKLKIEQRQDASVSLLNTFYTPLPLPLHIRSFARVSLPVSRFLCQPGFMRGRPFHHSKLFYVLYVLVENRCWRSIFLRLRQITERVVRKIACVARAIGATSQFAVIAAIVLARDRFLKDLTSLECSVS